MYVYGQLYLERMIEVKKYKIINITPQLDKSEKDIVIFQISSAVFRELVKFAKSKYDEKRLSA